MNGELIAPMTYEETMTSDFFEAWFQKFFLPTLTTPSVIIMDNARFHRMGVDVHLFGAESDRLNSGVLA
ncbi:IS630-Spn1, transposase Orf2 [Streptococcus pneumoniae]|nr:IS630-Spn1, transposase Orf2 [Streptococcus pneumoniae]